VPRLGFVRLPPELRRGREQTVHVGRQPARQGVVAFDDLEQRLLLAEEVLLGPGDDSDREVADQAGLFHLGHRGQDALTLGSEGRLQRDEHLTRLECQRGDRESLDDLIRIGPQDRAVLERARLAFGPVAHGVTVTARRAPHRAPLRRDGEAGATAAAQPGPLELGDRRFRPDLLRPGETCASSRAEPLLERFDGLVAENDLGAPHQSRKLVAGDGRRAVERAELFSFRPVHAWFWRTLRRRGVRRT